MTSESCVREAFPRNSSTVGVLKQPADVQMQKAKEMCISEVHLTQSAYKDAMKEACIACVSAAWAMASKVYDQFSKFAKQMNKEEDIPTAFKSYETPQADMTAEFFKTDIWVYAFGRVQINSRISRRSHPGKRGSPCHRLKWSKQVQRVDDELLKHVQENIAREQAGLDRRPLRIGKVEFPSCLPPASEGHCILPLRWSSRALSVSGFLASTLALCFDCSWRN